MGATQSQNKTNGVSNSNDNNIQQQGNGRTKIIDENAEQQKPDSKRWQQYQQSLAVSNNNDATSAQQPCDCSFFGSSISNTIRAVTGKASNSSNNAVIDTIGSPLPDTPQMQRRLEAQQKNTIFSSVYLGLEKEVLTSSSRGGGTQSLIDSLNMQIQNDNDTCQMNDGDDDNDVIDNAIASRQLIQIGKSPTTMTTTTSSSKGSNSTGAGGSVGGIGLEILEGAGGGQSIISTTTTSIIPQIADGVAQIHEGPDAESYLHAKYILQEVLGVGSTSTVHRCKCRSTGDEYACKIVDFALLDDRFHGMMKQFCVEIETLMVLQHPAIIRLYDVYIVNDDKIFIVMELMEGGELFDYVVQKGTLTEEEASSIVYKVTSALVFMHSKNIMHRDLKPENLLLKEKPNVTPSLSSNTNQSNTSNNNRNNSNNTDLNVKVIDFGLSKELKEEQPVAQTFLGTRGYLAPEMLQRLDYTRAVDTWALGVIVFVLLCGCLPFDDDTSAVPSDDVVRAKFVLRFPRWAKTLSASAKDLLCHLLDVNPRTRYTAQQAFNHPWVQGVTVQKNNLLQSPGRIKKSPLLISSIKSQTRKIPGTTTSKNPTPVMSKTAARRYGGTNNNNNNNNSNNNTPTTPSTIYTKMIAPANTTTGTRKAINLVRQASL